MSEITLSWAQKCLEAAKAMTMREEKFHAKSITLCHCGEVCQKMYFTERNAIPKLKKGE